MRLPQSFIQSLFIRTIHLLSFAMAILFLGMFPADARATSSQLACTPTTLRFGRIVVDHTETLLLTLTNNGQTSSTISAITLDNPAYTIASAGLPLVLLAGESIDLSVSFTPRTTGWMGGAIQIASDASNAALQIEVEGAGEGSASLTARPSIVSFGQVAIGASSTIPVVLTNARSWDVTLSALHTAGDGFSMNGPGFPMTLGAGQSITVDVSFAPQTAGTAGGSLFVSGPALAIFLTGTGTAAGQLVITPEPMNFGNVLVGATGIQPITLSAAGGSVIVSSASSSSSQFVLEGATFPLAIAAGQSATFKVAFTPQSGGMISGSLLFVSNASSSQAQISNPSAGVPLSGTGLTQGAITANATTLAFGSVQAGKSMSLPETLTNTGGSAVTISAAYASGSGFSLSGLSIPLTLNAGQSASFTVSFSPTSSGAASGDVSISSNSSNSNLSIPLSGTGATPGALIASATSLAFSGTQVGNSTNLSVALTNTGGSAVAIAQANVTGAGFAIARLSGFPINLLPNQSVTFTTTFTPTAAGAASGSLSVVSNASDSQLGIALSGMGTAAGQLTVSPTGLSFGNVVVGSSASLTGSLTASGAAVTVTAASINNGEFAISGISPPVTIPAGQSATFTATFTPQASGATSAGLSFSSNATNSTAGQSMTGTGTSPTQHSVDLAWTGSADAAGYNIYRGTTASGPFTILNASLNDTTTYTDSTVVSGQTYYYTATAVNAASEESGHSNQAQAVIPNP